METKVLSNYLKEYLEHHKQIRTINVKEDEILYILNLCRVLNTLDSETHAWKGFHFDDIVLPSWCDRGFIYPRKVFVADAHYFANDVLWRGYVCADDVTYDERRVRGIAHQMSATQKKAATFKTLTELRGDEMAMSQLKVWSIGDKVRVADTVVSLPIELNNKAEWMFDDAYFNYTKKDTLELFFARAFDLG